MCLSSTLAPAASPAPVSVTKLLRDFSKGRLSKLYIMEGSDAEDAFGNFFVRRARPSDSRDVARIYASSLGYLDEEDWGWVANLVERRGRRARVYVALERNAVVGFAIVYSKGGRAYVDALAVDPRHRGRGIGRHLLQHIERRLAAEGISELLLSVKSHNVEALSFYLKNGYKTINVAFVLEAATALNADLPQGTAVRVGSTPRVAPRRGKLLETALWNELTWDVDSSAYGGSDAVAVSVYTKRRLLGVANATVNREGVASVKRLALSFYRPTEALRTVVQALSRLLAGRGAKAMTLSVDSSKHSLLRALLRMGFKVVSGEYVLSKDLAEAQGHSA